MHHNKAVWAFIALLIVFFLVFIYAFYSLREGKAILGILGASSEAWLTIFLSIAAMGKVVYEIILFDKR